MLIRAFTATYKQISRIPVGTKKQRQRQKPSR